MAEEKGFDFQSMSGEMLTTQAKVTKKAINFTTNTYVKKREGRLNDGGLKLLGTGRNSCHLPESNKRVPTSSNAYRDDSITLKS
eukprot:scaffold490_cov148-Skeletonema_menzelii.AAC.2